MCKSYLKMILLTAGIVSVTAQAAPYTPTVSAPAMRPGAQQRPAANPILPPDAFTSGVAKMHQDNQAQLGQQVKDLLAQVPPPPTNSTQKTASNTTATPSNLSSGAQPVTPTTTSGSSAYGLSNNAGSGSAQPYTGFGGNSSTPSSKGTTTPAPSTGKQSGGWTVQY